jgi:hypothetical protein
MIESKQIERLYNYSYITYLATFFGAIMTFWLFHGITEAKVLSTWFILFSVITLFRFVSTWCFKKYNHKNNIELWFILFLIATAISGTMWGITGFIFIPEGSLSLLDSVLYQGTLLLFISTLVAGSVVTYSASKTVYLVFSVPAIIPQSLMLISQGDKYHSFLGGVVLAYVVIMFIIAFYFHRIFAENTRIEMRNEYLESTLKKNGIKID